MTDDGIADRVLGRFGRQFLSDAVSPGHAMPWVATGCLTFLTAGSFLRLPPATAFDVVAAAGALLLGLLVVTLLSRAALALRAGPGRTAVMVVGYGTAEVARVLMYDLVRLGAGALDDLGHTLVAGFLTGIAAMGTVTALVVGSREFREQHARLLASRADVERLLERARSESERDRERLLAETREVLDRALGDALQEGERTGDAAGALLELVDSTVRPLSRRLNDLVAPTAPPTIDEHPIERVSPRLVLRGAVSSAPFDPRPLLILTAFLALGTATFWSGPGGVLGGWMWLVSVLAVIVIGLGLSQILLERPLRSLPLVPRAIVIGVIYVAVMSVTAGVDAALRGSDAGLALLYNGVIGATLPLLLGGVRGLAAARAEVLAELSNANERIRLLTGRTAAILWSEQRALARAVHRDIQATTIAAAWRYSLAAADPRRAAQALAELRVTINEAVAGLHLDPVVPTTRVILERVRGTWDGICAVEVEIGASLRRELDDDAATRRILLELLSEFVTNAVKHGRASRARATLSMLDDNTLELLFWNDGAAVDLAAARGLGMHEVMRLSLSATVENRPDGVLFRLLLPR